MARKAKMQKVIPAKLVETDTISEALQSAVNASVEKAAEPVPPVNDALAAEDPTQFFVEDEMSADVELMQKLSKQMRSFGRLLPHFQAQSLVRWLYGHQKMRVGIGHQINQYKKTDRPSAPHSWYHDNLKRMENDLTHVLHEFAKQYTVSRCLMSWTGIGPKIAAGTLATFDVRCAPTCGNFYTFAGCNPNVVHLGKVKATKLVTNVIEAVGGDKDAVLTELCRQTNRKEENIRRLIAWQRGGKYPKKLTKEHLISVFSLRPYSLFAKTLVLGKAVPSFIKNAHRDSDFYGKFYYSRKEYEWANNLAGRYVAEAAKQLRDKDYGVSTDAYKWYTGCVSLEAAAKYRADVASGITEPTLEVGTPGCGPCMLPLGHINRRAMRWVGKLFLSHVHRVMYLNYYGQEPPPPHALTLPGHTHLIDPPSFPSAYPGLSLQQLYAVATPPV